MILQAVRGTDIRTLHVSGRLCGGDRPFRGFEKGAPVRVGQTGRYGAFPAAGDALRQGRHFAACMEETMRVQQAAQHFDPVGLDRADEVAEYLRKSPCVGSLIGARSSDRLSPILYCLGWLRRGIARGDGVTCSCAIEDRYAF